MPLSSRVPAFLAYLLLVVGWVYVLLFRRQDRLAVYHTKQSIMLILVAVGSLAAWGVLGWLVAQVPLVGPIVTTASFSFIITIYIILSVNWIIGMVYALQAKIKPLPIVGGWAEQLPIK